jgi:hypothetical protein
MVREFLQGIKDTARRSSHQTKRGLAGAALFTLVMVALEVVLIAHYISAGATASLPLLLTYGSTSVPLALLSLLVLWALATPKRRPAARKSMKSEEGR